MSNNLENQTETYNLVTYNTSTLSETLKLIPSSDFQSKITNTDKIYRISFKISSSIGTKLNETSFAHFFDIKHSVLITFESTIGRKESKIFWKLSGCEEFHFLELTQHCSEIVTEFCGCFLIKEIGDGRCGILKSSQSKEVIEIHDIGNEDEQNLLILAALESNVDIVEKLLEFGLNVEHEDNEQYCAIDKAWQIFLNCEDNVKKEKSNQIFLKLLKANSAHPAEELGFEYEKASKEVQEFIDICEKVHKDVENGNYESLREQMKLNPNLRHFYNRDGFSLIYNPDISKNAEKVKQLISMGLSFGFYEDIKDIYSNFQPKDQHMIRKQHEVCAKQNPNAHLLVLKQKSTIGGNDSKHEEHWKYIEDAFETLNKNKLCSKILKVVAAWNSLQIIFDFKQDTVYYLDPTKSESVRGVTYNSGKIYVGAQYLMSQEEKFSVIGVIIHELCHFAVLITFMNDFDPFPIGESEAKRRFDRIVASECERNKEFDPLVLNVYNSYEKAHQHSELIVLAAQMLMHYYVKDPKVECENSKRIAELQQKYGELFKYVEEVVEPELERAVKMLKTLQNTSKNIRFKTLTEPMKAKVLHSKINFQEEETTFFELIGNDLEVLDSIPSETLYDLIIKSKKINVSDIFKKSVRYKIIERKFTSHKNPLRYFNNPSWGNINNSANEFKQIINIAKELKMFILSDTAGSGKTTTFIDLTKKLKKEYKNFWVVYIKLRAYEKNFKECREFEGNLNKEHLLELFLEMLNLHKIKMEKKIFTKLFNENKAILLLDGIDEICPNYNELIIEIIDVLKQSTENQLWISTRPQHATQLDQKFKVPIYKFQPYTENDIVEFIAEILKVLLPQKEDKQNEALQFLKNFLKSIEESFSSKDYSVNNPLMIEVITELHVSGEINLQSANLNIFKVFEQIVDKQIKKVENKIKYEDRTLSSKPPIETVHQVFSIRFLFKSKPDLENLNDLSIFKNWKKYQHEWTSEKIQRFGFMTVHLNDQNSVDFTHRTYAEFFLTKLIVSHIFDDSINVSNEERKTIFKLFLKILNQRFFYGFIFTLISSYVKNATVLTFPDNVKNLIIKEIPAVRNYILQSGLQNGSNKERKFSNFSQLSGFIRKVKSKKFKDLKIVKAFKKILSPKKSEKMEGENYFSDRKEYNDESDDDNDDYDDYGDDDNDYGGDDDDFNDYGDDDYYDDSDDDESDDDSDSEKERNSSNLSKLSGFVRKIKSKKLKDLKIVKAFKNILSSKKREKMRAENFSPNEEDDYDNDSDNEEDSDNDEININSQHMKLNNDSLTNLKFLELFVYILKSEPQHIKSLWLVGKTQNLLYKILTRNLLCSFESLKTVLEILEFCFGSNFHLILSKKSKNMMTDKDLNGLVGQNNISNFSINLLKLIDLIKKCYKEDEIKCINSKMLHECMILDYVENEIQMKIFLDVSEAFRTSTKDFLQFLILSTQTSSENICKYIGDNIEEFLKRDKNDMRTFLFHDYSEDNHPLIKSLFSNRADIFKSYKELFTKYKATNDEIQAIFITSCDLSYLFFTINDETYQEFKNFISDIFSTNKEAVFSFIEYHNIKPKGISKAFEFFEDFASSFFNDDTENVKKLARKLFPFSYYQYNHPLIDSAKMDSEEMFVTCKKLFTKYLCSNEELKGIFLNYCFIPEMILCIRPRIYPEFKSFVKNVFLLNKELISKCLMDGTENTTKTMRDNAYTEAISFSVYDENTNKLRKVKRITMFYVEGFQDTEENEKYWIKAELLSILSKIKLFEDLILFLFMEDPAIGWAMIKQSLFQTRQIWDYLFMRNINTNYWLKIETITNEQKLEHFEEISLCYCVGDAAESRNFIRKILFYDNNPDYHSFHRVIKMGNLEKFKRFKKFYIKYKNSWEELQEIFISFCDLHRIFSEVTDEIYLELRDLLLDTFVTNKDKIFECFDKSSWMYYHPERTMKMFKKFENLSSVLFINDKAKSEAFMRQIVFHKYWINYHQLVENALASTTNELQFFEDIWTKYLNSNEISNEPDQASLIYEHHKLKFAQRCIEAMQKNL